MPDPATLTAASPAVNWTLELTKIIIPPFLTLIGVYIGFKLANKGRKYDILYKERYKSTEETIGYINNLLSKLQDLTKSIEKYLKTADSELLIIINSDFESFNRVIRDFNHKYLVILDPQTRNNFYTLETTIKQYGRDIINMKLNKPLDENSDYIYESRRVDAVMSEYSLRLAQIELGSKITINGLFNSLKLPKG